MEFVILCGGYGTRFQKVSTTLPKILVEIKPGISMLDWLIEDYLPKRSKIILASGHLHKKIYEYVKNKRYDHEILFSQEKTKMGTGGAIANASNFIESAEFIALNGDTIQEVEISDFLSQSNLKNNVVINVGCSKANNDDSGKIIVNEDNLIINFSEKKTPLYPSSGTHKLYSSLGMYRCKSEYFKKMTPTFVSLEDELLPKLVIDKKASASIFNETYHDFGTLERYQKIIGNKF